MWGHIQFNIRQKLFLMVAVFFIPITLMSWLFIDQAQKEITFSLKELKGVEAQATVWPVLSVLAANTTKNTQSPPTFAADAPIIEALAPEAFNAFEAALSGDPADARDKAYSVIAAIADASNLTLDPDLDTYYLMDAMSFKAPEAAREISVFLSGADFRALQASEFERGRRRPWPRDLSQDRRTIRGANLVRIRIGQRYDLLFQPALFQ